MGGALPHGSWRTGGALLLPFLNNGEPLHGCRQSKAAGHVARGRILSDEEDHDA
jgi:hypothetical protein